MQGNLLDTPIDINRLVAYSFQKRGANWHGRSMLRGCYALAPEGPRDARRRHEYPKGRRRHASRYNGHPGATESDLRVLSEMTQRFVAGDRSGGAIPYGATLRWSASRAGSLTRSASSSS
jgi:hypothetical protein